MDREIIGRRIRDFRKRKGLSGKEFAIRTGFSPAAVSRFERGLLRPTQGFIDAVIPVLELSKTEALGLREVAALFNSQFQRWSARSSDLEKNQRLIGERERNATVIRSFWGSVIPGLLQTERYMRAVLRSFTPDEGRAVDAIVRARLKRQEVLLKRKKTFVFVLWEGCLRARIGSQSVLAEQLGYLEQIMVEQTHIEVRVLPFDRDFDRVSLHHFVLYDERTVEVEVNKGQIDLWTDEDVCYHIDMMNFLIANSLPHSRSREFIGSIRRTLLS